MGQDETDGARHRGVSVRLLHRGAHGLSIVASVLAIALVWASSDGGIDGLEELVALVGVIVFAPVVLLSLLIGWDARRRIGRAAAAPLFVFPMVALAAVLIVATAWSSSLPFRARFELARGELTRIVSRESLPSFGFGDARRVGALSVLAADETDGEVRFLTGRNGYMDYAGLIYVPNGRRPVAYGGQIIDWGGGWWCWHGDLD